MKASDVLKNIVAHISRRLFASLTVGLVLLGLCLYFLFAMGAFHLSRGGPNQLIADSIDRETPVILISVDTLRWDDVFQESTGSQRETLPSQFMSDALSLYQVVSHSPWTLPAHASLFSGMNTVQHGAVRRDGRAASIPDTVGLIPEYFQRNGYRTGAITDGGYVSERFGFDRGFGDFTARTKPDKRRVKYTLSEARSWINKQSSEQPYFLFLHSYQVHDYWRLHDYCVEELDDDSRRRLNQAFPGEISNLKQIDWDHPVRASIGRELYKCEIDNTMEELGKFFQWLRDRGQYEDTLIVFFSDHGEGFSPENNVIGHGRAQFEEEIVRVPVVLKLPGNLKPSYDSETLVPVRSLFPLLFPNTRQFLNSSGDARSLSGTNSGTVLRGSGTGNSGEDDVDTGSVTSYFARTSEYRFTYDPGDNRRIYHRVQPRALDEEVVPPAGVPANVKTRLLDGFNEFVERGEHLYNTRGPTNPGREAAERRRREVLDGLGYMD